MTQINIEQSPVTAAMQSAFQRFPEMMMQYQQYMAQNRRADAQLLMQEAQFKYQNEINEKTEKSSQYLKKHTGGHNWAAISGENVDWKTAFALGTPSIAKAYDGYSADMQSVGLEADDKVFFQTKRANDIEFYTNLVGRFNTLRDTIKAKNPNSSEADIDRYMAEHYNAQALFNNTTTLGMTNMQYQPRGEKKGNIASAWDWTKSWVVDEPLKDAAGANIPGTGGVNLGVGVPLAGGAYGTYHGYNVFQEGVASNTDEILDQIKKDVKGPKTKKSPKNTGLDAKKFKETYGMTKSQAGLKGGKFNASDDILTYADDMAKTQQWGKVNKTSTMGFGRGSLPYLIGGHGGVMLKDYVEESLGVDSGAIGDIAAALGGGIGTNFTIGHVMKQLAKPSVAKEVAKLAPSLALKLGISSAGFVAPEGISTVLGGLGLAWTAYDLVQLLNSIK
jgi:hypothetical protein